MKVRPTYQLKTQINRKAVPPNTTEDQKETDKQEAENNKVKTKERNSRKKKKSLRYIEAEIVSKKEKVIVLEEINNEKVTNTDSKEENEKEDENKTKTSHLEENKRNTQIKIRQVKTATLFDYIMD